ncbi:glucokinase [Halobacillus andaensis]|uniref:Glucokinase n=1 Tax=Halobacillus andaensis TaxID=1176239 RepID=A0A917AYM9_HALAA|nr:ROK family glucokinase [Halobacillus andaensis]MBP2003097.1 glucokinase [Halobacillus andaensis]GGF07973.1 glucokinase [Halobacillus andaensis]
MNEKYCIGADIGGTTIKLAVISTEGEIIKKWEIHTDTSDRGKNITSDINIAINDALDELHLHKSSILGIGAGAPGFVDTDTGYINEAINIGWKDFDFGIELKELTGLPVWVDNDANLAALGENWLGAGRGVENLIAVTLGTGVGGGIIANGEVLNGANGTAAEIGHMTMKKSGGAPCNCGRTGCLETETSATAIVRKAKETVNQYPASTLSELEAMTARDVFEAADKGDPAAKEVLEDVIDTLGLALSNLTVTINPNKIVLGGGVSKAGEQLLKPLKQAYISYALPRAAEACKFELAELGNDAGVIGGASLVKQYYK